MCYCREGLVSHISRPGIKRAHRIQRVWYSSNPPLRSTTLGRSNSFEFGERPCDNLFTSSRRPRTEKISRVWTKSHGFVGFGPCSKKPRKGSCALLCFTASLSLAASTSSTFGVKLADRVHYCPLFAYSVLTVILVCGLLLLLLCVYVCVRAQVVNLHYILSKARVASRPGVLWCYKKEVCGLV